MLAMRTETALRWIAFSCAFVLLLAPLGDRTYWKRRQGSRVYDNFPYDFLALLAGVAAIFALCVALSSRPSRQRMVIGAIIAAIAFGMTAAALGFYWTEAARGVFRLDGAVFESSRWTVHPMTGYREFAITSAIGATSTFALALLWQRREGAQSGFPG